METSTTSQSNKASTVKKIFSRETTVSIDIKADPSVIWALLTNTSDYPRWNSTVTSIEGKIIMDGEIKLKSTLDPKRTFKLKIKAFIPNEKLIWGDAMGKRIFTLTQNQNKGVTFSMSEKIGGPMFPLFAKMIPSFDDAFDRFAADLKKEAEIITNSK